DLHNLSDDETIARLATGIKRFKLPDEYNYIKIYERVAGRGKSTWGEQARDRIASVYEDRRQYVKADTAWKLAIKEYGAGQSTLNRGPGAGRMETRQEALDQIVGNWGRFEPGQVQPAGKGATVDFRFRNGTKVSFEAYPINVQKLLADVKAYLTNHVGQ